MKRLWSLSCPFPSLSEARHCHVHGSLFGPSSSPLDFSIPISGVPRDLSEPPALDGTPEYDELDECDVCCDGEYPRRESDDYTNLEYFPPGFDCEDAEQQSGYLNEAFLHKDRLLLASTASLLEDYSCNSFEVSQLSQDRPIAYADVKRYIDYVVPPSNFSNLHVCVTCGTIDATWRECRKCRSSAVGVLSSAPFSTLFACVVRRLADKFISLHEDYHVGSVRSEGRLDIRNSSRFAQCAESSDDFADGIIRLPLVAHTDGVRKNGLGEELWPVFFQFASLPFPERGRLHNCLIPRLMTVSSAMSSFSMTELWRGLAVELHSTRVEVTRGDKTFVFIPTVYGTSMDAPATEKAYGLPSHLRTGSSPCPHCMLITSRLGSRTIFPGDTFTARRSVEGSFPLSGLSLPEWTLYDLLHSQYLGYEKEVVKGVYGKECSSPLGKLSHRRGIQPRLRQLVGSAVVPRQCRSIPDPSTTKRSIGGYEWHLLFVFILSAVVMEDLFTDGDQAAAVLCLIVRDIFMDAPLLMNLDPDLYDACLAFLRCNWDVLFGQESRSYKIHQMLFHSVPAYLVHGLLSLISTSSFENLSRLLKKGHQIGRHCNYLHKRVFQLMSMSAELEARVKEATGDTKRRMEYMKRVLNGGREKYNDTNEKLTNDKYSFNVAKKFTNGGTMRQHADTKHGSFVSFLLERSGRARHCDNSVVFYASSSRVKVGLMLFACDRGLIVFPLVPSSSPLTTLLAKTVTSPSHKILTEINNFGIFEIVSTSQFNESLDPLILVAYDQIISNAVMISLNNGSLVIPFNLPPGHI